jgi:hypothetical protein
LEEEQLEELEEQLEELLEEQLEESLPEEGPKREDGGGPIALFVILSECENLVTS